MNQKVHIDLEIIKFIYTRNKAYLLPLATIFISIVVFITFVLPQAGNIAKAKKDADLARQKITILKGNLDTLSRIDDAVLDSQLQILSQALPFNRDFFINVMDSVSKASQFANVSLASYSFQVGDLSKEQSSGQFPSLELALTIKGDIQGVDDFMGVLEKTFPLAEVKSVQLASEGTTAVAAVFYYKPGISVVSSDIKSLRPISPKDLELIEQLEEGNSVPSSTSSAVNESF